MRGLAIKFVQISDFVVVRILLESVDRDWPSLSKSGSPLHFPFGRCPMLNYRFQLILAPRQKWVFHGYF